LRGNACGHISTGESPMSVMPNYTMVMYKYTTDETINMN